MKDQETTPEERDERAEAQNQMDAPQPNEEGVVEDERLKGVAGGLQLSVDSGNT
jgi:hypothetical protein